MANEDILFGFLLWGFLLGKIIPTRLTRWKKIIWNRRGIPYFVVNIVQAGKIIHQGLLKQSKTAFFFDGGRYLTFKKDPISARSFSPVLDVDGESVLFYNKNNTNPLEFLETRVTPSHNNPSIFQTIIEDNSIAQALKGEMDLSALKRYILITSMMVALAVAGIMWFLVKM